jgi:hypothetical protein
VTVLVLSLYALLVDVGVGVDVVAVAVLMFVLDMVVFGACVIAHGAVVLVFVRPVAHGPSVRPI